MAGQRSDKRRLLLGSALWALGIGDLLMLDLVLVPAGLGLWGPAGAALVRSAGSPSPARVATTSSGAGSRPALTEGADRTPAVEPEPRLVCRVYFATNLWTLEADKERELAAVVHRHRDGLERFVVVGHTDARGSDAANRELGEKRARTVAELLISLGLPRARVVQVVSAASRQPLVTRPSGYQNRRAEVLVVPP